MRIILLLHIVSKLVSFEIGSISAVAAAADPRPFLCPNVRFTATVPGPSASRGSSPACGETIRRWDGQAEQVVDLLHEETVHESKSRQLEKRMQGRSTSILVFLTLPILHISIRQSNRNYDNQQINSLGWGI